jgi:serine/threonine protein kinase
MAGKSLYDVLEVIPWARPEVIQASYRALAKIIRPDISGGDEDEKRNLIKAYDTLSDSDKRSAYDIGRKDLEGKRIGAYRVLELISDQGGFGRTYKGEHAILGEPVCIKDCAWPDPQIESVLIEEARAIWDLRHYGIPSIRDLIKAENGRLFLIMSYVPGPTLEQIVNKVGRLDPEHVAWITERVLNILMYLHYHGVIHGDLKPQNIIIQPESHTVVLVDYGLSIIRPTRETDVKGFTWYFSPPEQMDGSVLLPESDLYSLGMTMIYALGGGLEQVKAREVPRDVPDAVCEFIRSLIVRNALFRPNWEQKNIFEHFQDIRLKSFGRANSAMKPIPGF